MKHTTATLLLLGLLVGCRQEKELIKPSAEINQLISGQTLLPQPVAEGTLLIGDEPASQLINGSGYTTRKRTFRQTKRFATHANATDFDQQGPNTTQGLYVGSIVHLKAFAQQGDLTSIGQTTRESVSLTSNLPGAVPKVILPAKSTYQTVLTDWTQQASGVSAAFTYEASVMNSTTQALLERGINVGWGPVSLTSKFSTTTDFQQQDILVAFRQVQHTVSMEYPGSAAGFFASSVDMAALRAAALADDPLGYVSEITYGRLLLARFRFSSTSVTAKTEVGAKLAAGLLSSLRTNFSVDDQLREQLTTSTVELSVLGGDAASAAKLTRTSGIQALSAIQQWIADGANTAQKAAPLSYKLRYLADNTPVVLGAAADYTEFSEFRLVQPKQVVITKLTVKALPAVDPMGSSWDLGLVGLPDVYFIVIDAGGEKRFALDVNLRKENVSAADLLASAVSWDMSKAPIKLDALTPAQIRFWDFDSGNDDDDMGVVAFDPVGKFPQSQLILQSNDGKIQLVLSLNWE
ncbi:thiol-activated cytolysin family protein [Fibrella sp. HMF5335]|uniref:Thiol-activated cytolysin family protein n=1 Tax=Fibrella rubiginis TaxID=2817060 RepID=A0A939K0U7_9BACT|nr:thiol-activated cytolysin family protein [Fibrella rubiginis]MBO0936472.1 thiol-activated cytolysin family protein [Fibrella rubiginis]